MHATGYYKEYYRKNRERRLEESKAYDRNHPDRLKRLAAKRARYKPEQAMARRMRIAYKVHGITPEDFVRLSASGCAICGALEGSPKRKSLHLDHCHKTGKFRGFLCIACNTGIGKFHDDPVLMDRAIQYLKTA